MKNLKWICALLMVIGLGQSCVIDIDDDRGVFGRCIDGDGPIVSQTFNLPTIEGIDLKMPGKVFITQGAEQNIIVEGKPNILDEISLNVSNRIWDIETDRCLRDIDELTFYITLQDFRYLSISGSGEIISEEFITTNDIELYIAGSGDMDLGLFSDDIFTRISGSGTVLLEGEADILDIEISGSGDYRAFPLLARSAFIEINGSGDAEVNVQQELVVTIRGSGDVIYEGNPTVDANISGSGRVVPN